MARPPSFLTGVERRFGEDEIIVSKTDTKGVITYANRVFLRVAQYTEEEVLGKPHNIIRHPDMPQCVFQLLWDTIQAGQEIFAYVVNRTKNGDHYWVFAHVTPTFDGKGKIVGYHSSRRCPDRSVIPKVEAIYGLLRAEEAKHANPREKIAAATRLLVQHLDSLNTSYEELMFALARG